MLQQESSKDSLRNLWLYSKKRNKLLEYFKTNHLDQILKIQNYFRIYRTSPRKLNVKKFKATLFATLTGWKVRRAFAILNNDKEVSEAIDMIKMQEDWKNQQENLFFKQILEKMPQKIKMFHSRLNEILNSSDWPEKPIIT